MDSEEKELSRQSIADFRYSVVAELCNPLSFKRREKGIDQRKNGPALCDTPFQENHHYGGYHSKLDEPLQT